MSNISMFVEIERGVYQHREDAIEIGQYENGVSVYIRNPNKPVKPLEEAAKPPIQSFTGKMVAEIYIKRFRDT